MGPNRACTAAWQPATHHAQTNLLFRQIFSNSTQPPLRTPRARRAVQTGNATPAFRNPSPRRPNATTLQHIVPLDAHPVLMPQGRMKPNAA